MRNCYDDLLPAAIAMANSICVVIYLQKWDYSDIKSWNCRFPANLGNLMLPAKFTIHLQACCEREKRVVWFSTHRRRD
nr:hypothetical protein [Tanacetum cinerariifolium]